MLRCKENDQRFHIGASTLPNAGLGLFAKQLILRGSHLEIIGVMVERGSVADQCTAYADNYKFGTKSNEKIWHIIPLGYAGMINNANTQEQQNCEIRNIKSKISNKKLKNKDLFHCVGEAIYYFIRDVKKGEEILGNYGHEWKKHQQWLDEYNKVYDENITDWLKFLNYELYNIPYLKEKIPLGDNVVKI